MASLAAVWLAMAATVHPGGEFPLADDWAYASSVESLLVRGEIELRPWTPAITLSHVLWGALAATVLGFSFETLRVGILLLGLVGILATYGLTRELDLPPRYASLAALTIAVNPVYFQLAGTFMTDVSFFAMSTLALWAFARALSSSSRAATWLGLAAAVLATLNRQIGLAVPAGFAVASLCRPADRRHSVRGLMPLAVATASLLGWELLAQRFGGASLGANAKTAEVAAFVTGPAIEVVQRALWNGIGSALYLGLFSLPFVIVAASARSSRQGDQAPRRPWALALGMGIAGWLGWLGHAMPVAGNILLPTGMGPATLRDAHILMLDHLPEAPMLLRLAVTAASVVGLLGAGRLVAAGRQEPNLVTGRRLAPRVTLATSGALYLAPNLVGPYFDRYLLPVVPIILGLIAFPLRAADEGARPSRAASAAAAFLIALGAAFSVAGTHDYLAWNRARWKACSWLTEVRGAPPSTIDGGFEWNASRFYDPTYVRRPGLSWWWVQDDRWVVAFGPLEGRRIVHRVPYARWLPPRDWGEVVVLERTAQRGSGPGSTG